MIVRRKFGAVPAGGAARVRASGGALASAITGRGAALIVALFMNNL
jgi:hypothetical protein